MFHTSFRIAALKLYEYFGSMRQAAKALNVSVASICRWSKNKPTSPRRARCSSITDAIRASVQHFLQTSTCLSSIQVVEHIHRAFDVSVSRQLAHLLIKRLGFSYKRTRKRGVSARKDAVTPTFLSAFAQALQTGTVVAIDESGFDQRPAPAYGYAPKGVPAIVRWRPSSDRSRHNLVMAIHASGAVHRLIQDSAVNGPTFSGFVAGLPFARGTVLLLDNASIHKTSAVKQAMADKGYVPLFLPPYSPEYNPIELVFGVIKNAFYRLRYASTSTAFDLRGTVEACVASKATPSTIRGCFDHVAKLVSCGFPGVRLQA